MVSTVPTATPAAAVPTARLLDSPSTGATLHLVGGAFPTTFPCHVAHPGEFIGSVTAMDASHEGFETETFFYHINGQAQGHVYVAPLYSALSRYSRTTCWPVGSADQLHEWVKLEQLAAGLRQAYRRQRAVARQQNRDHVPALERLLDAAEKASEQADAHAAAPMHGHPRNHGLRTL
jgi:hypothetical protein